MKATRTIKKLFLLITLPMVMWLFFSQAAFWHFHKLDNGIVVQHSHPFKNNPFGGTPIQSHQHTDFEYLVLAQLSMVAGLLLLLFVLGTISIPRASKLQQYAQPSFFLPIHVQANPHRGPPEK